MLRDVDIAKNGRENIVQTDDGPTKRGDHPSSQESIHVKNEAWGENAPEDRRQYEGKYSAPEDGGAALVDDPTFITGVPSAPTPVSGEWERSRSA